MSSLKENEMKKLFDEIVELCEKAIPEYGEDASYFLEPASEEEITEWEQQTNISIPESYKLWLKLTRGCGIRSGLAEFFFPSTEQPEDIPEDYVPEDWVIIGNIIGDGELVCFSKTTKKIIRYFDGKNNGEYEEFIDIIKYIKEMLMDEGEIFTFSDEMMAKFAEFDEVCRKKEENK